MKQLNKFTGFLKITLFTIAVLSLVKFSHAQTWVTQNSGTANTLHGVWFLDNLKGFAVGDIGTIRYTINGGTNWLPLNGVTNEDLHDVAFSGAALGIIVGDNGRVYRSTNGGTVWQQQVSGVTENLRTVSIGANGMVYAAGVNGVTIRSTNGGITWSTVSTGTTRYRGSSAIGSKAWLVGDNGIIKASSNSGSSFSAQNSNSTSDMHGIFMLNELTGYTGGQNDMLLYTNNGGSSWTARNSGIQQSVNAIHFSNSNTGWVVCEAGAVYRTTNGGVSWVNDNSGAVTELEDVYFPDINRGWTVGAGGVIKFRGGTIGVVNVSTTAPDNFSLGQNFPNPFNPSTKIKFAIINSGKVNMTVYDINGRKVEELVNSSYNAGTYEVNWDASKYSSGVYFYTIVTNDFTSTKRMLLVK